MSILNELMNAADNMNKDSKECKVLYTMLLSNVGDNGYISYKVTEGYVYFDGVTTDKDKYEKEYQFIQFVLNEHYNGSMGIANALGWDIRLMPTSDMQNYDLPISGELKDIATNKLFISMDSSFKFSAPPGCKSDLFECKIPPAYVTSLYQGICSWNVTLCSKCMVDIDGSIEDYTDRILKGNNIEGVEVTVPSQTIIPWINGFEYNVGSQEAIDRVSSGIDRLLKCIADVIKKTKEWPNPSVKEALNLHNKSNDKSEFYERWLMYTLIKLWMSIKEDRDFNERINEIKKGFVLIDSPDSYTNIFDGQSVVEFYQHPVFSELSEEDIEILKNISNELYTIDKEFYDYHEIYKRLCYLNMRGNSEIKSVTHVSENFIGGYFQYY